MIRHAVRRRVLSVVVVALIGLMSAPIDECDDYASFHPGAASADSGAPEGDPDGSNPRHVCSCVVCDLATDDTFVPRLQAPLRGELVAVVTAVPSSSADLPGIYHPPNA